MNSCTSILFMMRFESDTTDAMHTEPKENEKLWCEEMEERKRIVILHLALA